MISFGPAKVINYFFINTPPLRMVVAIAKVFKFLS